MNTYDDVVKAWRQNKPEWLEIEQELYDDLLEAVPPAAQKASSYLFGEIALHDNTDVAIYFAARYDNGRYYAKLMSYDSWVDFHCLGNR